MQFDITDLFWISITMMLALIVNESMSGPLIYTYLFQVSGLLNSEALNLTPSKISLWSKLLYFPNVFFTDNGYLKKKIPTWVNNPFQLLL